MRVTVRLFARLRDIVGSGELPRDAADDATLGDVWRALVRDYPALEPYTSAISGARNADYVRMDAVLANGDEVAFLPPVSGGTHA
jgi:molybdopterin converting factor small subunit